MHKLLIVAFALIAVAHAGIVGNIQPSSNTAEIMEIAKWSMASLSQYTGVEGKQNWE